MDTVCAFLSKHFDESMLKVIMTVDRINDWLYSIWAGPLRWWYVPSTSIIYEAFASPSNNAGCHAVAFGDTVFQMGIHLFFQSVHHG
jgi:hypothetical protein